MSDNNSTNTAIEPLEVYRTYINGNLILSYKPKIGIWLINAGNKYLVYKKDNKFYAPIDVEITNNIYGWKLSGIETYSCDAHLIYPRLLRNLVDITEDMLKNIDPNYSPQSLDILVVSGELPAVMPCKVAGLQFMEINKDVLIKDTENYLFDLFE